ncbi:metal ABC transporter permease [Candidatus Fermentibacterales bacterium]|nr:metal ABC transporter permease [Candidatus Fermentibacterales bacterium]
MTEALGHAFMQNAIAAAMLGSIACGVVGTLVVVNRMSALTGSIAHAAFGGLGLSYLVGIHPLAGAALFSLGSGLGIGAISSCNPKRSDTVIAAFWAIGMALGLVFIRLAPGYAVDLMSYLFGSILSVTRSDLLLMASLDVVILALVGALFRRLVAVSYDPEFARANGLRVRALFMLMVCLTALSVVMLVRIAGLIMVIAMMTIPASVARLFLRTVRAMMILSVALSAAFMLAGLALAWVLDLPTGAVIILVSGLVYFLALLAARTGRARRASESLQAQ